MYAVTSQKADLTCRSGSFPALCWAVKQLSSGHLPWSVRRMHEDRALPAAEVRAGTRWGWEMLGPLPRRYLPRSCFRPWSQLLMTPDPISRLIWNTPYPGFNLYIHLSASEQTSGTLNMEGTSSLNLQMRKLRPREAKWSLTLHRQATSWVSQPPGSLFRPLLVIWFWFPRRCPCV